MGLIDRLVERLFAKRRHVIAKAGQWNVVLWHEMPLIAPLRHEIGDDETTQIQWDADMVGAALTVEIRVRDKMSAAVVCDLAQPMRDRLTIERDGDPVVSVLLRTVTVEYGTGLIRLWGDTRRDLEDALTMEARR
jgi:hypothetical protein